MALDPTTVAALRAHQRAQREERFAWGPAYQDMGLVFCRENGSPIRPDTFTRRFGTLARAAGLPIIRVHDVRHTYASIGLAAGTHPKVMAERLGHATVGITLDTYSHVLPALQEEAATRIADLILTDEASPDASVLSGPSAAPRPTGGTPRRLRDLDDRGRSC